MNRDYEEIKELLERDDLVCIPIQGGKSGARVYKAISGQDAWAVKLFPAKPRLNQWYMLLREVGEPHLLCACACAETEQGENCTAAPWMEGTDLLTRLREHPGEAKHWGRQAGSLVRRLHAQPVDEARLKIRYADIWDSILDRACEAAQNLTCFPKAREYGAYLQKARRDLRPGKTCLLHKDLHLENFVIAGEELYLMDFENGGLGEREQDLARFLYLSQEHSVFRSSFLDSYGEGDLTGLSRERCRLYTALMLLEEAEWREGIVF